MNDKIKESKLKAIEILLKEADLLTELKNKQLAIIEKGVFKNTSEPIWNEIQRIDEEIEILALKAKDYFKL